jgi:hypothetical protein
MVRRNRVLGIADQGIASLSNVAMAVVAARALAPADFGGFALAMAVYAFVLGVARALATEPLLVTAASDLDGDRAGPAGAMAAFGVVGALACAAGGALVGGPAGACLLAIAPFLPLLLLQDGWRYVGFAAGRPAEALFVDVVWVLVQAAVTVYLVVGDATEPAAFVIGWAAAGAVAALAGAVRARTAPGLGAGWRWVRRNLVLGGPFMADFLVAGGAASVGLWLLGAISGLDAAGAIRAGQTLFGPINILYLGILVTLLPEGARRVRVDRPGVRALMGRASLAVAAVAGGWTLVLVALPSGAGRAVLGETWPQARSLLVPLGASMVAGGLAMGATAGLRAIGEARVALRARLLVLPAVLGLPIVGAAVADDVGFAYGLAGGMGVTAAVWWVIFARTLSAGHPTEHVDEGLGGAVPGQLGGTGLAGVGQPGPQAGVAGDPDERGGDRLGRLRIDE